MGAPTASLRSADKFGPWADGLSTAERRARIRCLRTIVHLVCGTHGADLAATLEQAEFDADALRRSVDELARLASLDRRKVLTRGCRSLRSSSGSVTSLIIGSATPP